MQRFAPHFILRSVALSACATALVFLSGCANMSGTASPSSLAVPLSNGSLHGGQQPIQGAHVYLYAATTSGYGNASTSLMLTDAPGTTTDTNGNAYVTSDANGGFSYGGTYETCAPGTQIYLLALGGNATGVPDGPSNDAIALSAALGDCVNLNASTFTEMNEATTVAMAYGLGAFMLDPTHVSTSSGNVAGLATAFLTVSNLVDNTTGLALTTTPGGNGTAPQQYVNTLANIIASCVNQGAEDTSCSQLFTYATTASSAAPQDTLSALIHIAAFPATQTANLYSLTSAFAPFQPSLEVQPNDFALGITYSPTDITAVQPGAVVIDAAGNIWMANCQSCVTPIAPDSLLEFSPTGEFLHSYTGATVAPGFVAAALFQSQVLHRIKGIAIDATGNNIYTINQGIPGGPSPGTGDDQMLKMSTSTGVVQAGFPIDFNQGTYGVDTFNGIAVDNSGEIWATAVNAGAIIQATPNGNLINGSPFFIGGTLGVGVDNIGNIWFAGTGGNNLIQFDTNGDFLNNFTPPGFNQPLGIAINGSNEIWTINNGSNSLSRIEFFNGSNGSGSPYTTLGLAQATITAIDGTNQVLVPNCRASCPGSGSTLPDNLLRLSQSGDPNVGDSGSSNGAEIPSFSGIGGAAIDASGNVWVSNSVSGTVTEVIGFAAPTIQPIAAASSTGRLGQMP